MTGSLGALAAIAVVVVLSVLFVRGSRARPGRVGGEAVLLRLCRGDREQVERLIAFETAAAPDMPRAEAARRAVERRRRDDR